MNYNYHDQSSRSKLIGNHVDRDRFVPDGLGLSLGENIMISKTQKTTMQPYH